MRGLEAVYDVRLGLVARSRPISHKFFSLGDLVSSQFTCLTDGQLYDPEYCGAYSAARYKIIQFAILKLNLKLVFEAVCFELLEHCNGYWAQQFGSESEMCRC